ncbi:MAG: hypothetical protein FIA92_12085 [Chloroflexi bacterium]|nr:hypothetical protein [Chloroflexota bacterium]
MPAERIAESLAFINWTILGGLAVGTLGAAVAGRLLTEATRGYLVFIALCAAAFGALAALSDGALPALPNPATSAADPAWEGARRLTLAALPIVAVAEAYAAARARRSLVVAALGLGCGIAVIATAALSWGGAPAASLLLAIQLTALSAALGGVWAAMVLGHWYLVTPRLPEAPLVRFARWLTAILALQVGLFAAWTAFGAGPAGHPGFAALTGEWALFVWLRLLVGLVFPLIVSWAAIQTARSRSMESATGLLYINVGTIAAGTIVAAGLYFGAGLLV